MWLLILGELRLVVLEQQQNFGPRKGGARLRLLPYDLPYSSRNRDVVPYSHVRYAAPRRTAVFRHSSQQCRFPHLLSITTPLHKIFTLATVLTSTLDLYKTTTNLP